LRRLGIFFGGRSSEHEASVHSAKVLYPVIETLDVDKVWIYMARDGRLMISDRRSGLKQFLYSWTPEALTTGLEEYRLELSRANMRLASCSRGPFYSVDAVLPLLHGGTGEDGSIQGLCKMFAIPCAGPTVLGAAISLDKAICKSILSSHGIPMTRYLLADVDTADFNEISRLIRIPMVIKPRSEGSSAGVSFAGDYGTFQRGLALAKEFSQQCIVEEYVEAVEIHCYVLRTRAGVRVSRISGTIPAGKIYSHGEKMNTPHAMKRLVARDFPTDVADCIRPLAREIFTILDGSGLARLDFFWVAGKNILFNEINSIPAYLGPSTSVNPWEDYGLTLRDVLLELFDF
jgi:D-alanine-D-alanine ligase